MMTFGDFRELGRKGFRARRIKWVMRVTFSLGGQVPSIFDSLAVFSWLRFVPLEAATLQDGEVELFVVPCRSQGCKCDRIADGDETATMRLCLGNEFELLE